jgi:hypothetical protein
LRAQHANDRFQDRSIVRLEHQRTGKLDANIATGESERGQTSLAALFHLRLSTRGIHLLYDCRFIPNNGLSHAEAA